MIVRRIEEFADLRVERLEIIFGNPRARRIGHDARQRDVATQQRLVKAGQRLAHQTRCLELAESFVPNDFIPRENVGDYRRKQRSAVAGLCGLSGEQLSQGADRLIENAAVDRAEQTAPADRVARFGDRALV